MKYILLIYQDEQAIDETGRRQPLEEFREFTRRLEAMGISFETAPLHSVETATSVRVREGRRQVIDGPFTETREQLGGYFIIDVEDLDEAIGLAAQIPTAKVGTIEIRPIMDCPGSPPI